MFIHIKWLINNDTLKETSHVKHNGHRVCSHWWCVQSTETFLIHILHWILYLHRFWHTHTHKTSLRSSHCVEQSIVWTDSLYGLYLQPSPAQCPVGGGKPCRALWCPAGCVQGPPQSLCSCWVHTGDESSTLSDQLYPCPLCTCPCTRPKPLQGSRNKFTFAHIVRTATLCAGFSLTPSSFNFLTEQLSPEATF